MREGNKGNPVSGARGCLHAAGLIGALSLLFFHPGAMDMDRIKTNLLLLFLCLFPLPVLAAGCGGRRFFRGCGARLPAAFLAAALVPACLLLPFHGAPRSSTESLGFTILLGGFVFFAWRVSCAAQEQPERNVIPIFWLLAAGGVAGIYAIFQAAGVDPFYVLNPGLQAVSSFGNTNELAEVMALLLPLALPLSLFLGRGAAGFSLAVLPCLTAGLWLSGGRAGLLAAICGSAAFFGFYALEARRGRVEKGRLAFCAGAAALGLLIAALLGSPRSLSFKNIPSKEGIFSAEYPTNKARIEIWKGALDLIQDHPLFGVGPGCFRMAYPPYRNPAEECLPGFMGAPTEVRDPHNEFLWAAAEGGLPAFAAFTVFLLLLLKKCFSSAKKAGGREERLLRAGAGGVVLAFFVLSLFRAPLHSPAATAVLFLTAGLAHGSAGPFREGPLRGRGRAFAMGATALLVAGIGFWIGLRGLRSDWLAASTALKEKMGPEEFAAFQRAADLDPHNIDIWNFVGQVAANKLMGTEADRDGRYREEAFSRLEHVLRLHPLHPGALKTLERIRAPQTGAGGARKGEEGGASAPDLAALKARAIKAVEEGALESAMLFLDRYLQQCPLDGDALHLLGKCLLNLHPGAEEDAFRRMHLAFALDWMEQGAWKQAAASLERSLRYGEGLGEAALLLGLIDSAQGKTPAAPEGPVRNQAVLDRLREMATYGRLPENVSALIQSLEPP